MNDGGINCDCGRENGCAACGGTPRAKSGHYPEQPGPELVPCQHCDRLVYAGEGPWVHTTGAKFCHPWENDECAEPSAAQSDERKAG